MGDSQVSGNRQHRVGDDHAVRLMQYLTIGKLLTYLYIVSRLFSEGAYKVTHLRRAVGRIIGPILWGHSAPLSPLSRVVVVVVLVDINTQAACDSSDTW